MSEVEAAFAQLLLCAAGIVLCVLGFVLINARRSGWALVCLASVIAVIALVLGTSS